MLFFKTKPKEICEKQIKRLLRIFIKIMSSLTIFFCLVYMSSFFVNQDLLQANFAKNDFQKNNINPIAKIFIIKDQMIHDIKEVAVRSSKNKQNIIETIINLHLKIEG